MFWKRAARPLIALPAVWLALWVALLPISGATVYAAGTDWPQFDYNAQHSGVNPNETTINTGNVSRLAQLFQVSLPDVADSAPAYLSGVQTGTTTRDLLFVTTKAGDIVALDAVSGQQVWSKSHPAGSCRVNNGSTPCYTTSSPAVDPNGQHVYTYGLDGLVHKHAVADGTEVTTGGWPETATIKPYDEKGSSALTVATVSGGASYLYVANGGYPGDRGDYQGHVTTINLADGSQTVFNANCSDLTTHLGVGTCNAVQTAVWARSGVVYSSDTNRLYFATGNGFFLPNLHDWGDSVLAINPNGTGSGGDPLDSYTPTNFQSLQNADLDLGSTAPAVLPPVTGSSVAHLAVQGGKDAILRLLDLDNLSGQGIGHTGGQVGVTVTVPQGGQVLTAPTVWTNPVDGSVWVFVVNGSGAAGLKVVVNNGTPALQTVWQNTSGGTSPILAGGVLFYVGSNHFSGLNPTTGQPLWTATNIGGIHWESPIVVNGRAYVTDEAGHLTAYDLKNLHVVAYMPLIWR
jgi:outer membrane protein assembly factor BamB